jgi:uncharacterized PurR-regulated membrane protein YhhQ (DUF165 family)
MKILIILLYLLAITGANVVTASFAPLSFGMFLVPAGSFLIGATFICRDFVQQAVGRRNTYLLILTAMLLSAITSYLLGDTLWIVFASTITFLFSETTDTEIYTRLKLSLSWRVLYSGIAGGILDSIIFVIIGLSPIGAGFLTWEQVVYAIMGQMIVKVIMQVIGAIIISSTNPIRKHIGRIEHH